MKKVILSLLLFHLVAVPAFSQSHGIAVSNVRIARTDGAWVLLEMTIAVSPAAVGNLQSLSVTPILSDSAGNGARFPSVLVNGRNRARIWKRHKRFRYTAIEQDPPLRVIDIDRRFRGASIDYSARIPGEGWMERAEPGLELSFILPADERRSFVVPVSVDLSKKALPTTLPREVVSESVVVAPPVVVSEAPAPIPSGDVIKRHSTSGTTDLDFDAASSVVLPAPWHLADLDKAVRSIASTPGSRIVSFTLTGYSSPDGHYDTNMAFARERAAALSQYIRSRYDIPAAVMKIRAVGEDWTSLRRMVVASELPFRDEVLKIIDSPEAPDAKESRLRRAMGGRMWHSLEREFFRSLRKIDFCIDYEVAE